MAWSLPRLLRRLQPQVAHFQHALPLGYHGRSVVTVHDLHFEHDPTVMGRLDRITFKTVVPRAVRRADHVLAVSEATKRDIVGLYGIPAAKVTVTPHGVDPAFAPGDGARGGFVLFVGAVQARKDPLTAAAAAAAVGLPLVVVGPEKEPALASELRARGADVRGWVDQSELARLYREADALVLPSRFEGFGVPVLEAMASGLPVVLSDDAALAEVAGTAGVYADDGDYGAALQRALDERERWAAAGIERAKSFSWEASARASAAVYREVLA
jgi:glycosyltransferase involved in cell wall biosynthesis